LSRYLLVGQGICGTWLSYYFEQSGIDYTLYDQHQSNSASRVASGVINPVTGRRIVKTWMIEALLPFVWEAYQAMGAALGSTLIHQKNIIDFFATPQMRAAFMNRLEEDDQYIQYPSDQQKWHDLFQYEFGFGEIHPCYHIDLAQMLNLWRAQLLMKGKLIEESFQVSEGVINADGVQYQGKYYDRIIFCEGAAAFKSPYFSVLPFGLNKGEALWVSIPDMPDQHIYKKGLTLVPWSEGVFWLGSTYLWEFDQEEPSAGFRQFGQNWLQQVIKKPFTIEDHRAAVRPATLERRPFVGWLPHLPTVGILNGMGTKGCSLAPWFAHQFTESILHGTAIDPLVSVTRFEKILRKHA
jgi:glycine/D-amino acid oxidase-like deaminating enzyme